VPQWELRGEGDGVYWAFISERRAVPDLPKLPNSQVENFSLVDFAA